MATYNYPSEHTIKFISFIISNLRKKKRGWEEGEKREREGDGRRRG